MLNCEGFMAIDAEEPDKTWSLFDCGPRSITCPLVCLPPVSGTADVFFLQVRMFFFYSKSLFVMKPVIQDTKLIP